MTRNEKTEKSYRFLTIGCLLAVSVLIMIWYPTISSRTPSADELSTAQEMDENQPADLAQSIRADALRREANLQLKYADRNQENTDFGSDSFYAEATIEAKKRELRQALRDLGDLPPKAGSIRAQLASQLTALEENQH